MKKRIMIIFIVFLITSVFAGNTESMVGGFVKLNNGEVYRGDVTIQNQDFSSIKIVLNDSIEYQLGQIFSCQTSDGTYYRVLNNPGLFSRPRLVERTVVGPLELFIEMDKQATVQDVSIISGPDGVAMTHFTPREVSNTEKYFCKNGGPLMKINYKNLKANLYDCEESMAYLNSYKKLSRIQNAMLITGLGFIISGISKIDDKGTGAKTHLFIGVGLGSLSWIPYLAKNGKLLEAVEEYNLRKYRY